MTNFFARQAAEYINDLRQSMGTLMGIGMGVLADGRLDDQEITFLKKWLEDHDAIANEWPGDVLHKRLHHVLLDGAITPEERSYLVATLQRLVDGDFRGMDRLGEQSQAGEGLPPRITFEASTFCFTGEFVYGPRDACIRCTERRGGVVLPRVTKRLNYLIVGMLGSKEWKHGVFGGKVQQAMNYKNQGILIEVLAEDLWTAQL